MITKIIQQKRKAHSSGGQAHRLRALVARRNEQARPTAPRHNPCRTIVIAGGKGGVGRSVIAVNLAIQLAQQGTKVGLVEATAGLGNVGLLCGLHGYWNLEHVALGCRELSDVVQDGPAGIQLLSGAGCLGNAETLRRPVAIGLNEQLQNFERGRDWLIVDAGGGESAVARHFASSADDVVIVTTPETTAIAEAYAFVKSMASAKGPRIGLLINQSESPVQAHQILDRLQLAARSFLQVDLFRRGFIPRDVAIPASVNERVPFVLRSPNSPAAIEMAKLAERWTQLQPSASSPGFFARLLN